MTDIKRFPKLSMDALKESPINIAGLVDSIDHKISKLPRSEKREISEELALVYVGAALEHIVNTPHLRELYDEETMKIADNFLRSIR